MSEDNEPLEPVQEEEKHELSLESEEPESNCLACDALDYFCTTIDDEEAKSKCAKSVKAVQEGLLDAGDARNDIMKIIGEEKYGQSVEKTNDWISGRFEKTRQIMQDAAKAIDEPKPSDKMLPEEEAIPEEPIDNTDKMLEDED